eukprot:GHVU01002809.1.p3 GENE.GHVU01002809.1~~GHVU01002809.1.p3  ORF type:complete len:119 (+),score=15.40 GHVU01002809.1:1401-1757(+)
MGHEFTFIVGIRREMLGNKKYPLLDKTEVQCATWNDVNKAFEEARKQRIQTAAAENNTSSRRYSVFELFILKESERHGTITFVDLAGSEKRADNDGNVIKRDLTAVHRIFNPPQVGKT